MRNNTAVPKLFAVGKDYTILCLIHGFSKYINNVFTPVLAPQGVTISADVDTKKNLWIVNHYGEVWRKHCHSTEWHHIAPSFAALSIVAAPRSAVYALSFDSQIYRFDEPSASFSLVEGLTQVVAFDVDHYERIIAIQQDGEVYLLSPKEKWKKFTPCQAAAKMVAAFKGGFYLLTREREVYQYQSKTRSYSKVALQGTTKEGEEAAVDVIDIDCSSTGTLYFMNKDIEIFQLLDKEEDAAAAGNKGAVEARRQVALLASQNRIQRRVKVGRNDALFKVTEYGLLQYNEELWCNIGGPTEGAIDLDVETSFEPDVIWAITRCGKVAHVAATGGKWDNRYQLQYPAAQVQVAADSTVYVLLNDSSIWKLDRESDNFEKAASETMIPLVSFDVEDDNVIWAVDNVGNIWNYHDSSEDEWVWSLIPAKHKTAFQIAVGGGNVVALGSNGTILSYDAEAVQFELLDSPAVPDAVGLDVNSEGDLFVIRKTGEVLVLDDDCWKPVAINP